MNPYIWLAGLLFVLACTAGGYRIGGKVARADCQADRIAALEEGQARLKEVTEAARATERVHVERAAKIESDLIKERTAHETLKRRDRSAALDGSLKLRVGGTCQPDRDPGPETRPAASVGDGAAGGELPREVAAALLDLANDADEVVGQLTACQRVVEGDRAPRKDTP